MDVKRTLVALGAPKNMTSFAERCAKCIFNTEIDYTIIINSLNFKSIDWQAWISFQWLLPVENLSQQELASLEEGCDMYDLTFTLVRKPEAFLIIFQESPEN